MGRKTIILREDQFNEICGTNTAYLDNDNDYAEDGTVTTKAAGAASDSNGEKEYSKPITGKEWGHELAPETLFALLFRNGGHGLWGHWGSGLRADTLDGFDNDFGYHDDEDDWDDDVETEKDNVVDKTDPEEVRNEIKRLLSILIDLEGEDFMDDEDDVKEKLQESNSELEGNTYVMDLGDGKKKRSYTSLTTEKNELEQEIVMLRRNGNLTPEGQAELEKKMDRLYRINLKLGMETKRVKDQKRVKKNIFGDENAFIKPHTKNSKNGKAHSKKTKDPNVGTGFITYTE